MPWTWQVASKYSSQTDRTLLKIRKWALSAKWLWTRSIKEMHGGKTLDSYPTIRGKSSFVQQVPCKKYHQMYSNRVWCDTSKQLLITNILLKYLGILDKTTSKAIWVTKINRSLINKLVYIRYKLRLMQSKNRLKILKPIKSWPLKIDNNNIHSISNLSLPLVRQFKIRVKLPQ